MIQYFLLQCFQNYFQQYFTCLSALFYISLELHQWSHKVLPLQMPVRYFKKKITNSELLMFSWHYFPVLPASINLCYSWQSSVRRLKVCLLEHCARIDEKETKGRKNSSVKKIKPAFDAGRVRISRFTHSVTLQKAVFAAGLTLRLFAQTASKSSQLCSKFFSVLTFLLHSAMKLKGGNGRPAGALRLSQELGRD